MCTQKLWRALGNVGTPPRIVNEVDVHGSVLGTWAAKLFHRDRRGLVIALNEKTCLTVVFALAPRSAFRANFGQAIAWALEDLGVPSGSAEREAAAIDFLPLASNTIRSMTGSLNALEFLAQCELDCVSDFRHIQRRLNEYPHGNRHMCIAEDAVPRLFASAVEPLRSRQVH